MGIPWALFHLRPLLHTPGGACEAITPRPLALPHGPREAASPHCLTAKSLFFCLSLSHQPRPPGLLHSGLPGDWQWGQGRGCIVVGGRGETSQGQPVAGPGPSMWCWCTVGASACLGSCQGPQPGRPHTTWSSLAVSEPMVSAFSSCACLHCPADPRFPPRCLTRTWGLVGSQDRNVVTTRGGG